MAAVEREEGNDKSGGRPWVCLAFLRYTIITVTVMRPDTRAWKLHFRVYLLSVLDRLPRGCPLPRTPVLPLPLRDSFL